jgi:3-oxoadipate enol-lactonase
MPRVTISNGQSLGYVESGGGEATPIIFLHGVGSDKSVWQPQLDHFGKTRRALAFDYPGYGDSDPAPDGTTRDDYAAANLSAMEALTITQAHICGLSLGGVVAIAMHHFAAERCASLVLADTFAVHPEGRAIYERSLTGSGDLPAMAEARVDVLLAQPADPEVRREVVETMSRIDPAAYRMGAEAVWLADQRERAATIRVPTLVLCGTEDKITPPDLSDELASLIPGAQLELIDGAGHVSNIERQDRFNGIVGEFVSAIDRSDNLGLDKDLKDQLFEARGKIVAQLDELKYRASTPGIGRRGGPPDYGDVVAELEKELREINDIFGMGDADQG